MPHPNPLAVLENEIIDTNVASVFLALTTIVLRIGHCNSSFGYCESDWIGRLLNRMRFMHVAHAFISIVIWIFTETCFYHVRSVKCSFIFIQIANEHNNEFIISGQRTLDVHNVCIPLDFNTFDALHRSQLSPIQSRLAWFETYIPNIHDLFNAKIRNRTKRKTTQVHQVRVQNLYHRAQALKWKTLVIREEGTSYKFP